MDEVIESLTMLLPCVLDCVLIPLILSPSFAQRPTCSLHVLQRIVQRFIPASDLQAGFGQPVFG
ncbi:hypothetical protein [Nocardia sp. CA-135398]|uniref:hypothetical protein n=1 Tax=Nocardia sp. CA-135398 TaxID=3239977 RepID=UPI003D999DFF